MQTTQLFQRQSALSVLFSRYLNGDITERAWKKMMQTFDQEGVSATERMAFARFMSEVIDETEQTGLNVPKPEEMTDILSGTRSTRH
jgi:Ca2+-binding EF-hand superfamily protein